jgi:hypothetical protein
MASGAQLKLLVAEEEVLVLEEEMHHSQMVAQVAQVVLHLFLVLQ